MRDSVPSGSYSSVCNVLRQWNILLIPTYRVYRLYDKLYTLNINRNMIIIIIIIYIIIYHGNHNIYFMCVNILRSIYND